MRPLLLIAVIFLAAAGARPADSPWDTTGLKLAKPEDKEDAKSVAPPKDAVVLFDGKSLDGWTAKDGKSPVTWKLVDGGAVEVKGGDILSKTQLSGDFKLHVEFRVPYLPKETGQARGNSGLYVQGRYEVQVLDSYGIEKPASGDCGGIYGVEPPAVNASKAPAVWQRYDIEFHSPKFADGKKTAPARMTVWWNGVKVHDDTRIPTDNTTAGLGGDPSKPGPLMLQDHGSPVQYRNLWLAPLAAAAGEKAKDG